MPILPAIDENTAPVMYAIAMVRFWIKSFFHIGLGRNRNIKREATPTNLARTIYSFARKVFAPLRIKPPTCIIRSFDTGCFLTHPYSHAAKANDSKAIRIDTAGKNAWLNGIFYSSIVVIIYWHSVKFFHTPSII